MVLCACEYIYVSTLINVHISIISHVHREGEYTTGEDSLLLRHLSFIKTHTHTPYLSVRGERRVGGCDCVSNVGLCKLCLCVGRCVCKHAPKDTHTHTHR